MTARTHPQTDGQIANITPRRPMTGRCRYKNSFYVSGLLLHIIAVGVAACGVSTLIGAVDRRDVGRALSARAEWADVDVVAAGAVLWRHAAGRRHVLEQRRPAHHRVRRAVLRLLRQFSRRVPAAPRWVAMPRRTWHQHTDSADERVCELTTGTDKILKILHQMVLQTWCNWSHTYMKLARKVLNN